MQPCIRFANIDDLSSLLDIKELSFSKHIYRNIINHLINNIED